MRDDPQDRQDALFIIERNEWKEGELLQIFQKAVVPELREIHEEFDKAKAALLRY